jgi:hypothetical protein
MIAEAVQYLQLNPFGCLNNTERVSDVRFIPVHPCSVLLILSLRSPSNGQEMAADQQSFIYEI